MNSALGWALVLWLVADPDGPKRLYDRVRETIRERRRAAVELGQTLDEIHSLPETNDEANAQ